MLKVNRTADRGRLARTGELREGGITIAASDNGLDGLASLQPLVYIASCNRYALSPSRLSFFVMPP